MEIHGYAEAFNIPVELGSMVDGWGSFGSLPAIASHLAATQADEELLFDTLGVTEEAAQDARQRLSDEETWPVLRIPLRSGDNLVCVYGNFPDDETIDFLVEFKDFSPAAIIHSIGENFGPGISWPELRRAIYETPLPPGVSPAVAFLIFLPMLEDASARDEATSAAAEALSRIGGNENSGKLAVELLDAQEELWGPAHWTLAEGEYLVCDIDDSPRRIGGRDRETLVRVTRALA